MQSWKSIPTTGTRIRRRLRQERGQSLVEFAIVLPVLLLIIMGILYFGRFEDYANFDPPGTTTLDQYIVSQAQPELQSGSSDVPGGAKVYVYYPTGSSNAVGNMVRACVVFKMTFPIAVGTPATTVAQAASMRIEQIGPPLNWTADSATTAAAAGCPIS
jgi:hypothetical protein